MVKKILKMIGILTAICITLTVAFTILYIVTPDSQKEEYKEISDEAYKTDKEEVTTAEKQREQEKKEEFKYLLPDSDKRNLTEDDLENFEQEDLKIARNEIFARHGYIFNSQDLKDYFGKQSWYDPKINGADFDDSVLNKYEKYNIDFIKDHETQESDMSDTEENFYSEDGEEFQAQLLEKGEAKIDELNNEYYAIDSPKILLDDIEHAYLNELIYIEGRVKGTGENSGYYLECKDGDCTFGFELGTDYHITNQFMDQLVDKNVIVYGRMCGVSQGKYPLIYPKYFVMN